MHKTITKYVKGFIAEGGAMEPDTMVVRFTHDETGETISIAVEDNRRQVMLGVPFEPVAKIIGEARRK